MIEKNPAGAGRLGLRVEPVLAFGRPCGLDMVPRNYPSKWCSRAMTRSLFMMRTLS